MERYWPGVTEADVRQLNTRLSRTSAGATGAGVRFLGSFLVGADELVIFHFRGTDSQAVLELGRLAELRCDRIVAVAHLAAPGAG